MADITEMTLSRRDAAENRWMAKETLSTPGAGSPIRIPGGDLASVSWQITGDGTFQATNFSEADIVADDPSVEWIDVPDGSILNPSVSFVRQVNISGTTILNLGAQ